LSRIGYAMTDKEAYIALNMIQGIGPVSVAAMISALGTPQAILDASRADLMRARGVGPEISEKILTQRSAVDPVKEIEAAGRLGFSIITQVDEAYPRRLKEIHDPPLALYVMGSLDGVDHPAVAVVGTRHATHYGRDCAERLSYQLGQVGFTVVSGLALGIDTAAHKGAMKSGGKTIAVIGSSLDNIYPPENQSLAGEISRHGAVISEFPLGRKPDRTTFPIRNRIVSGLSMGTVVVEAGTTSGALITAKQALEQGRSVFAVPGRIDSPGSRGPHRLIRDGACLIEDVQDILDEFEFLIPARKGATSSGGGCPRPRLSPEESRVIEILADGAMDIDSIIRQTALDPGMISSLLIGLEMKKVVRMLPGRHVELTRIGTGQ